MDAFAAPSSQQQHGGAAAIHFDQSASLTFHHVDYLLRASVRYAPHGGGGGGDVNSSVASAASAATVAADPNAPPMPLLLVEAEARATGARWVSEFSARYIEEMSLKTGSFKKFTLFLRMLQTALSQGSEAVFVDLLTFGDLEALKARKGGAAPQPSAQQAQKSLAAAAQNKRYLILTYVSEFDKVHYPLPLRFEDPTPQQMAATIQRLRGELDSLRAAPAHAAQAHAAVEKYKAELYRLAEENHRLKSLLAARGPAGSGASSEEKSSSAPSASASNGSSDSSAELSSLRAEVSSLTQVLAEKDGHLVLLTRNRPESLEVVSALDGLSKTNWGLREELRLASEAAHKARAKAVQEQEIMLGELERRLEAERSLRSKVRGLQEELDELRAATGVGGGSNRRAGGGGGGSASSSLKGPAGRRPLSSTTPSPTGARGGRPLSTTGARVQVRANSRGATISSRPSSANSSRASSPAPSVTGGAGRGRSISPAPIHNRSRSASPALSNGTRFDPSAYVKHRAAQLSAQQARHNKAQRNLRANGGSASNSPQPARDRSPLTRSAANLKDSSPVNSGRRVAANRSASQTALNGSSPADRSRRSPRTSTAGPLSASTASTAMPPRAPKSTGAAAGRPGSAASSRAGDSHSPVHSSRPAARRSDDDSEAEREDELDARASKLQAQQRRDQRDTSDEDADDRPRAAQAERPRGKEHDSIDDRFSALQNFLKQQKVEGV